MPDMNSNTQETMLRVNSLVYEFPPQLSVSSKRHRVTNYFQRNSYNPSETMVLDSQTGSTFVYGPDSYLTFSVQSDGADGTFGSGSCLNFFSTIRVKTRGGQELNRIENFNVLASKHAKWTNEDSWLNSEASSLGFANGAVPSILHTVSKDLKTQYTIPLKYMAPIFAQSKLLPPQLCEGLRLEIELEKSATVLVGAGVTGYTISQPQILFDATTIADGFTRRIGEISATQGLNILYTNFYSNQVSGSAGQSSFNYDVKKAASKCMRLWVVSRNNTFVNAAASDSMGSLPYDYSSVSTHIGADYVPNVPIKISGMVATDNNGGVNSANVRLTSEAYYHVLSAVRDQELPKYPTVPLEHINYNVINKLDTVLVFSYNKSTLDNISGYEVNNSRALIVDLEMNTVVNGGSTVRRIDNWMEHLRNVNIFPNQSVISD